MAVSYVNSTSVYVGSYETYCEIANLQVDDLVVLLISGTDAQTVTGVSTTGSTGATGSWQSAGSRTEAGMGTRVDIWFASVTTAGAIRARPTGSPSDAGFSMHAYRGCATSSQQDGAAQYALVNYGDTTFSTGTISTSVADSVLVAIIANELADRTVTWTDYTQRTNESGHVHKTADRLLASTGTYGCAGSLSSSGVQWLALMACFKGSSTGTVVNPWWYYSQQLHSLKDKWRGLMQIPSLEEVKLYGRMRHAPRYS